jgi:hypothetical protein
MSFRDDLLDAVGQFVMAASQIPGVRRIALVGSLVTEKEHPKDADLLVTIGDGIDVNALAAAGRKLKGRMQGRNSGADIFLSSETGNYLGRTCSYRECHPRMACRGRQCSHGTRICDDFDVLSLDSALLSEPPLELWPAVVRRVRIPQDVERVLVGRLVGA